MQLIFDFPVHPKYSFENFVVCGGNRTGFEFARRLASASATPEPLYLYGPDGSGKTHLLSALAKAIAAQEGAAVPILSCQEIPPEEICPAEAERGESIARQFREAPTLLIDDIHLLPAVMRGEIWDLFNDFYNSGRIIAITGIDPPKELKNLDEHLASRLLWGLVARMDVSDDESRRLIVRKLAEDRQIALCDDSIEYILRHTRRDIPSLLQGVEMIQRCSLAANRKISLRLVREVLT